MTICLGLISIVAEADSFVRKTKSLKRKLPTTNAFPKAISQDAIGDQENLLSSDAVATVTANNRNARSCINFCIVLASALGPIFRRRFNRVGYLLNKKKFRVSVEVENTTKKIQPACH